MRKLFAIVCILIVGMTTYMSAGAMTGMKDVKAAHQAKMERACNS